MRSSSVGTTHADTSDRSLLIRPLESAGARPHHQAVDGGEVHGDGDAATFMYNAQAGPVAEMGDDQA
jgi:hypothetical protein